MKTQKQHCSCKRERCARHGNCRRRTQIAALHFTAHAGLNQWEQQLPTSVREVVAKKSESKRDGDLWGVPWSTPVDVEDAAEFIAARNRRRLGNRKEPADDTDTSGA